MLKQGSQVIVSLTQAALDEGHAQEQLQDLLDDLNYPLPQSAKALAKIIHTTLRRSSKLIHTYRELKTLLGNPPDRRLLHQLHGNGTILKDHFRSAIFQKLWAKNPRRALTTLAVWSKLIMLQNRFSSHLKAQLSNARIKRNRGNLMQAIEILERLISQVERVMYAIQVIDPEWFPELYAFDIEIKIFLGDLYNKVGRPKLSIRMLAQTTQDNTLIRSSIGRVRMKEYFRRNRDTRYFLAQAFVIVGQTKEALEILGNQKKSEFDRVKNLRKHTIELNRHVHMDREQLQDKDEIPNALDALKLSTKGQWAQAWAKIKWLPRKGIVPLPDGTTITVADIAKILPVILAAAAVSLHFLGLADVGGLSLAAMIPAAAKSKNIWKGLKNIRGQTIHTAKATSDDRASSPVDGLQKRVDAWLARVKYTRWREHFIGWKTGLKIRPKLKRIGPIEKPLRPDIQRILFEDLSISVSLKHLGEDIKFVSSRTDKMLIFIILGNEDVEHYRYPVAQVYTGGLVMPFQAPPDGSDDAALFKMGMGGGESLVLFLEGYGPVNLNSFIFRRAVGYKTKRRPTHGGRIELVNINSIRNLNLSLLKEHNDVKELDPTPALGNSIQERPSIRWMDANTGVLVVTTTITGEGKNRVLVREFNPNYQIERQAKLRAPWERIFANVPVSIFNVTVRKKSVADDGQATFEIIDGNRRHVRTYGLDMIALFQVEGAFGLYYAISRNKQYEHGDWTQIKTLWRERTLKMAIRAAQAAPKEHDERLAQWRAFHGASTQLNQVIDSYHMAGSDKNRSIRVKLLAELEHEGRPINIETILYELVWIILARAFAD